MSQNSPVLRPEAAELEFDKLHAGQRQAFGKLSQCLAEAVAKRDSEGNPSRILFVSGPRGVGKTTLLLTARHLSHPDDEIYRKVQGNTREKAEDLKLCSKEEKSYERLEWLETLKMQEIKSAREDKREDSEGERELTKKNDKTADKTAAEGKQAGGQADDLLHIIIDRIRHAFEKAEVKWEPFTMSGGLHTPGLKKYFEGFVKDRSEEFKAETGRDLFIFVIDDFDLNPDRALEMLRLIRSLKSPHLATIIFGDIQVAERVIQLKMTGDFLRVTGTTFQQELTLLPAEALAGAAENIAANTLRMLLPPSQRIPIKPMSVLDSLEYSHPQGKRPKTLSELLKELRIVANTARPLRSGRAAGTVRRNQGELDLYENQWIAGRPANTLHDLIFATAWESPNRWNSISSEEGRAAMLPSCPRANESKTGRRLPVYPGAAFFHSPARQIVDLWFELTALKEALEQEWHQRFESRWVALNDCLKKLISESGGEESHQRQRDELSRKLRQLFEEWSELRANKIIGLFVSRFRQAVQEDAVLSPREKLLLINSLSQAYTGTWELQIGAMRLVNDVGPERPILLPHYAVCNEPHLIYREPRDWYIAPKRDRKGDRRGLQPPLSDGLTGCLFLLHDLLALNRPVGLVGKQLTPSPDGTGWAGAKWESPDKRQVFVPWLTPPWKSFWEFSLFRNAWTRSCTYLRHNLAAFKDNQEQIVEYLFLRWISAASSVIQAGWLSPELQTANHSVFRLGSLCQELKELFAAELSFMGEDPSTNGKPKAGLESRPKRTRRPRLIEGWFSRLFSMLGPEAGLPGLTLDQGEWQTSLPEILNLLERLLGQDERGKEIDQGSENDPEAKARKFWRDNRVASIRRLRTRQALRFWEADSQEKALSLLISWPERIVRIKECLEALSPKHGQFLPPLEGFDQDRIKLGEIAEAPIENWRGIVDRQFQEKTDELVEKWRKKSNADRELQKKMGDRVGLHNPLSKVIPELERARKKIKTDFRESFLRSDFGDPLGEFCLIPLRLDLRDRAEISGVAGRLNIQTIHDAAQTLRSHALKLREGEVFYRTKGEDESHSTREMAAQLRHLADLLEYGVHPMNTLFGGRLCPTMDEILELKRLYDDDPSSLEQQEEGRLFL